VTWFAGLFYIVRLFIYHTETQEKSEPEKSILQNQFKIMSKRLWYGITWPSAIITLILGPSLLHVYLPLKDNPFMIAKLLFVLFLYIYHFMCHRIFKSLQKNEFNWSSNGLRVWNEVATVFLFAIVFLIILQDMVSMVYGILGLFAFSALLMIGIKVYKNKRLEK
jgi:putative membrane protein